jgi:hypothetical protein
VSEKPGIASFDFQRLKTGQMKQFISTKFFLLLQEVSQNGTEVDAKVLEHKYEAFAYLLFSKTTLSLNKMVFNNTLCYVRVEFASLQRQQSVEKIYPSG